jgi:hypothetical protein
MTRKDRIDFNALANRFQIRKPWDSIIIFILNILIAIPVFIIIHENIIDANLYFRLDRVFLFVSILIVIQLVLRALRRVTLVSIFLYLIALFYGTLFGGYGFVSVYNDYDAMMYSMTHTPYPQDIIIDKLLPFPNKTKTISAIEYENPKVRDFAIQATLKNFRDVRGYPKYRTIIQCFAVFKEINHQWNYVSDPKNEDYIASATESLRYFSGDCDDHSILMASCIKSIGGTPRLIYTNGHMFPEMLIGTLYDLETINFLIRNKLFERESQNKSLHYHLDERGQVWLNLDYTATYPGGPFLDKEILSALTLE